jgi:hypothetical protein
MIGFGKRLSPAFRVFETELNGLSDIRERLFNSFSVSSNPGSKAADNIPAVILFALQKHLEIERVHEVIVFSSTRMSNCYVPTAGIA